MLALYRKVEVDKIENGLHIEYKRHVVNKTINKHDVSLERTARLPNIEQRRLDRHS